MAIAGLVKLLRNVSFFDLNCSVVDMESFARDAIQPGKDLSPVEGVRYGNHMTTHRENARRQRPHVKIMNRSDAIYMAQLFS